MASSAGRALPPRDYIQAACELHLEARILPSEENASYIQQFLSDGALKNEDSTTSISNPRLFVWIPVKTTSNDGYAQARASTEKLDANNHGAIVFINTASFSIRQQQQQQSSTSPQQQHQPIQNFTQVSCIVLSPRVFEETPPESEEKQSDNSMVKSEIMKDDQQLDSLTQTLKYLQMYTRHCFVPVVQAMEAKEEEEEAIATAYTTAAGREVTAAAASSGAMEPAITVVRESNKRSLILESLQDKLRQLDVALDEVQRTGTGIAVLHLYTHPILARAARNNVADVSKINLEKVLGSELLQNDSFLNEVQSLVQTQWISSIQKITNLPREKPFPPIGPGSDMEESRFWKSLQEALTSCRSELAKPEVLFTIQVLKSANRFLATIALENNTGLDEAEAITSDINAYLQQIPLESLSSAREITRIEDSVKNILSHLPRARQSRYYDLDRLVKLVESITFTLSKQLTDVLKSKYKGNGILLHLKYDTYLAVQDSILQLWETWDHEFMKFKDWFVDHARKIKWTSKVNKHLTSTKIIESLTMHHLPLRERLAQISYFRSQHERILTVFTEVLGEGDDPHAVREVEEAPFLVFATVDVFDLDSQGSAAFYGALEGYDRRMDVMEERLARLLRTKLESAEDAEELFRVFARFNPLLFRNRIRAAVKDFQIQLIQTVTYAITNLLSKFKEHYETSPSFNMASARGIPPVSGKIIWAKQIERQVMTWMSRMTNVLGDDWGQQLEGRTLRRSCDELLAKLDARSFLRNWISEWERELISGSNSRNPSFPITIAHGSNSSDKDKYEARVNLDHKAELLFREVRTLVWLGFEKDIPRTIRSLSDEAFSRFPFAIALRSSLRSYAATRKCITPEMEPLLEQELVSIRDVVSEAFDASSLKRRITWDSPALGIWVTKLSDLVSHFENRVDILTQVSRKIDDALKELKVCPFTTKDMEQVVGELQKTVDTLSLAGFSHLGIWIDSVIDMRMQIVLIERLERAIQLWVDSLGSARCPAETIHVEIVLRNQKISPSPSPLVVRSILFNHLHDLIGIVLNLERPSGSKFEVFDGVDVHASAHWSTCNFHVLIQRITLELLCKAYAEAERHIAALNSFVTTWLSYQSLWDTRLLDVTAALGEDLHVWHSTLVETRAARAAIDSNSTTSSFGPVEVRYDKVRNQVQVKYDLWQQALETEYAKVLSRQISLVYSKISDARLKLERIALLEGTTADLVSGVTMIELISQNQLMWEQEVITLQESERLLKKQRHSLVGDGQSGWMETSRVRGQYGNLEQILEKRRKTMRDSMPVLQQRILAEDVRHKDRMVAVLGDWEKDRPLRGNIAPTSALETLANLEIKLTHVANDDVNLGKAKAALGMENNPHIEAGAVTNALEECSDLKEIWISVMDPYAKLQVIKDMLWRSITPRKVRLSLDELMQELRSLPNRVRQYDAYTQLLDIVKQFASGNSVVAELKTDALKERHWKIILSRFQIHAPLADITIGMLWDKGVIARHRELSEILTVAQGEMAIEVFLKDVKDRWMKQALELILYQNRIRLIKGWDNLFASLDDHMGGLVLMKSSPYYRNVREFQEEGTVWDERLSKLRAALDVWIDVQRRWLYLEGIFFGSADIKAQLPTEWSRFKNVDGDFVTLHRRISQRPYVMELLNIDNLQRNLERLASLMTLIQRALGEYLERQRTEFARFYFLGDEDLLEIVGNSGEPGKVLSHAGKMFAGISTAIQAEVTPQERKSGLVAKLESMLSKDGEIVPFDNKIEIESDTGAKKWLHLLESRMHSTLANLLHHAIEEDLPLSSLSSKEGGKASFLAWAEKFPAQVMILATLVSWSMGVDAALSHDKTAEALMDVLSEIEAKLEVMAESVLMNLKPDLRKKYEQLITELVHQRDVTRTLLDENVTSASDFRWLYHLRFQFNSLENNFAEKLSIRISNATFFYGYEYHGIGERLVQTPLTDRCYLTLTQALHFRLGGNPFGPAGTGKTESVKALGSQLGRFVVVMNCDETFDFGAMGRIFCGLCQVGAWGCFDEFNRLEERILSAVSQQILAIQRGLLERQSSIELLGRPIKLHENVGIFVTMNPGYAGRSNLPDNLKNLFRAVAMVVPDRKLIAQVMLFSQGIVTAELLSDKIVSLFQLCEDKMTKQRHYDFGLRALKTLLISAGGLKRKALDGGNYEEALAVVEKKVLIESACSNIVPKLIAEDLSIFDDILSSIFPGSQPINMEDVKLKAAIVELSSVSNFYMGERWVQKILQLRQVLEMRHGVMMVGPVAVGKSAALRILSKALEIIDGVKRELYIIDPKAFGKEDLYGSLDGTTLEWTDGVFTSILRKVLSNERGEGDRRHWIVFDGDVDPEWAENLNSVLDDNKLLTLPSGERLGIPDNLRIILEVDSLDHATPATVSRCGMVWFSKETLSSEMCLKFLVASLRKSPVNDSVGGSDVNAPVRAAFVDEVEPFLISDNPRSSSLVQDALEFALSKNHVMPPTRERLLLTLKTLLMQGIEMAVDYDDSHHDFPISGDHLSKFVAKWLLYSLHWSFAGSASWEVRNSFGDMLLQRAGVVVPHSGSHLGDYRVRVNDGEFELWSESVPRVELESHKVMATDFVIPTADTLRHTDLVSSWLKSRKPVVLCGPPGVGKSMSLISALQSSQNIVLASLNFSSRTTPDIIMKTFGQYCRTVRRGKDLVLEPSETHGSNTWLVVFCDEINLPEKDSYGTQRVIMFMRQLVEQQGYWRHDNVWVSISRIQFVGACNPPNDAGRVDMPSRFLRHASLLFVDFPTRESLLQIYRAFNGGLLRLFPNLRGECDPMTEAMVEFYIACQVRFTPEMQPQYFFSPRELSRWIRGIYEAISNMDSLSREELLRIWVHEGLRLFSDRLVEEDEREWCEKKVDQIAKKWLPNVDHGQALARPIYYTNWLTKDKKDISSNQLRDFLCARLRVFYEEELDVPLVVFDEVLEHVLRIDRVLRQPMGHCLLIGDSGSGKTVLSKFASWMNGLSIFQIKAHSRYSLSDFNEDLRVLMRRVGVNGEKVCFIFDEANALESGFLEAMNALLASGEVPGLFEGDDRITLIHAIRDSASKEGLIMDSEEELLRRFTSLVQRNLHVVFTMNPCGGEWKNRSTTSPALFNRCVVDWFGTWSHKALGEVGKEFTSRLDMGSIEGSEWSWGLGDGEEIMNLVEGAFDKSERGGLRQAVVAAMVHIHETTKHVAEELAALTTSTCRTYLSPRDYLTLIKSFVSCVNEMRTSAEDEQLRISKGLSIIRQTQENVTELELGLGKKGIDLRDKELLANQKLLQMVADQNEAEKRKEAAERLSAELEKQQKVINARKDEAQRDLDEAEPALLSAQASVKGIKRRDLDEVRGLLRPPNAVKLTLECVAIMMNEKSLEWADIRKMLSRAEFIPSILNFDVDTLTPRQIKIVSEKYLEGDSDLTVDSVTRSSKACGPLFSWAVSQIKYSTVYTKVQPLRLEVAELEKAASVAEKEKDDTEAVLQRLEDSIATYKADYAMLIRDVEALKTEMESVQKKVVRARSLITSLTHESDRWANSSNDFQLKLRSLVGDGLIFSSFLTYAGAFDFKTRSVLMKKWHKTLDVIGIEYRPGVGVVEMLSKASDRLHWQSQGLPGDSLSMENGVILDRCLRFPLIIDPSGHAIDYLMNRYQDQKVHKTSFFDKAFMKTLAGAIRFGTTLLVENVESIDPVLNPILNREIQRTGGRSLVRVGTEDVDYSPKFNLILSTKNPAAKLTPDLCSRVTILNFTVTPDSLESQSLSLVVKSENPEVEVQRINLLKLQGEQSVKLRELEEEMLAKISAVKGSILDDNQVVEGMEILTKEGIEVEEQIGKSAQVMAEVERVIAKFKPLGKDSRAIFVLLERMRNLCFLYEFSSNFFMRVLEQVLSITAKIENESSGERIANLKKQLYSEISARVGRALLLEDKIVLSVLLANLFKGINTLPERSDLSIDDITAHVEEVFGAKFPWQGRGLDDLKQVTEHDIDATVPLLFCSAPGHDVSDRVEDMARSSGKDFAAVAMGSEEGFATAEKIVSMAAKSGTWVLLKNCHLCTEWLQDIFVKKLHSLNPHPNFRIFLTSEINPKLPISLLRMSDVILAEAPEGVKASMSRFFRNIATDRFKVPVKNRLYFLLSWIHSVIQERLRYVPGGWSKHYDFTEADANHALDVIDSLAESAIGSKHNISPEKIPWEAMRATLCNGIFGGKITDINDQKKLDQLVYSIFVSDCFDVGFTLVPGETLVRALPDSSSRDDFISWIESLPDHTSPTWIGLDASAEAARARDMVKLVLTKISSLEKNGNL